jgi:hypothetical protein
MGLIEWIRQRWQARKEAVMFERQVVVTSTDEEVSASYPDGVTQRIKWKNVECVAIETNDSGPWGADFWWLLEGGGERCAYPQGATGELEILKELPGRFPGFSDVKVIEANGCTSNARFVCWEKTHVL